MYKIHTMFATQYSIFHGPFCLKINLFTFINIYINVTIKFYYFSKTRDFTCIYFEIHDTDRLSNCNINRYATFKTVNKSFYYILHKAQFRRIHFLKYCHIIMSPFSERDIKSLVNCLDQYILLSIVKWPGKKSASPSDIFHNL